MKNNTFNVGNLTLKLLKTVGSPFVLEQEVVETREEALELYRYAIKNKIGLLYLESLNKHNKLSDFGLALEYEEEVRKYNKQLITLVRASELLGFMGCDYAIFKSIMPFPATLNDIDIILFCSSNEFDEIVSKFLSSGYEEVTSSIGFPYPFKRDLHDKRECKHMNPYKKDVYDLDLYYGTTVSYIAYLDEANFKKYVIETTVLNRKVKILRPEADLVYLIVHSIITEQLLTLSLYYATIYHLPKISVNNLILKAKENNIIYPIKVHFSLTAKLHRECYGFIPEKIEKVIEKLGYETSEGKKLVENNFKMPNKYTGSVLTRTFLEKLREKKFRHSLLRQTVSMLNPKLTSWVVYNIVERHRRETY